MDVAELKRLVEYKFAPGPLLAVQGLANTYAFEEGDEEELIGTPGAARSWLVRTGLAEPQVSVGPSEHARLLDLRGSLRSLLDSNATGARPDPGPLRALAAEHPVRYALDEGGRLALDLRPASTVDEAISQLIGIVREAQAAGEWPRLKICASDECRWAFYDTSRNRSGTWCDMDVCGNKINNRAYRARSRS